MNNMNKMSPCWMFEEASGDTLVDSRGGVNGTLVNGTRVTPANTGRKAIHITGADNSYASFGKTAGQFGVADFTVAFWVNTSETVRLFDLLGTRTASSHGNFLSIRMTGHHESQPHGMVTAEVDEDGAGKNYISVQSHVSGLNDGKWHYIAVVRKANSLILFIDGVQTGAATGAGVANLANGNELRLGRSLVMNVPRFGPDAQFDSLCVWNDAQI